MALLERILASAGSSSNVLFYGALFFFSVFLTIKYIQRRIKFRPLDEIPGPPANFLFGNALDTLKADPRGIIELLTGKFCDYGEKITKVWLFTKPFVFVHDADAAEVILSSQRILTKSDEYKYFMPWLGTGLLTSTGSKWHSRRKMLTPAFHFKILEDFREIFNQCSNKLASKFEAHVGKGYFDIFGIVTNFTLEVILESAVGLSVNAQDNPELGYIRAVHEFSYIGQTQIAKPILSLPILFKLSGLKDMQDKALKILHGFSNNAIRVRRAERAKGNVKSFDEDPDSVYGKKKRLAFLDLLLEVSEQDSSLTDQDIREEVDTFVFEGHDTTAAGVSFAIFLLACHPEEQAKVHKELDSIFGDSDRPVTSEDLTKMKYLECCIKEAQRLYPSVPLIARRTEEPLKMVGYTIPADSSVFIVQARMHKDPKHFPNPEKFIPDRFFPENSVGRHPYAYIPFSAGPRNCIGQKFALMEEKVALSAIFRKFKVESAKKQHEMVVLGQAVTRPQDTIDVRVFPRQIK